ncbi:MAG: hypothetical protein WDZ57_01030 [Demequina sp.]
MLVAAFLIGMPFAASPTQFALFMITGLALGYILTRSRFGYAGGFKRIWMTGEGSLTKALVITFALASTGAAGLHWAAAQRGPSSPPSRKRATPSSRSPRDQREAVDRARGGVDVESGRGLEFT